MAEQKCAFIEQEVEKILHNQESLKLVQDLIEKIMYFSHKFMRKMYSGNSVKIFTQLFTNFDPSSSTYEDLFEPNMLNFDEITIFRREILQNLTKENIIDASNLGPLVMKKQHEVDKNFIKDKLREALLALIEVLKLVWNDVKESISTSNSEQEIAEMPEITNDMFYYFMDLHHKHFKEEIYRAYSNKMKEALPELEVFEEMGIDNLAEASSEQLNLVRKALSIIGYVMYPPGQIPYNLVRIDAPFFVFTGRRNLVI